MAEYLPQVLIVHPYLWIHQLSSVLHSLLLELYPLLDATRNHLASGGLFGSRTVPLHRFDGIVQPLFVYTMTPTECSTPHCAFTYIFVFAILLLGFLLSVFKLVADVLKVLILYLSALFENIVLPQLRPYEIDPRILRVFCKSPPRPGLDNVLDERTVVALSKVHIVLSANL